MPRYTVEQLISLVGELPPMPLVARRALEMIRDPDTNMRDLAGILAMDQALAALVLRWANSAYYGIKFPASTVQQAVTYLGMRTLHSLVLAASVAAVLERPMPGYGLERGELWQHAMGVAAGARLIAGRFGNQVAEEAYHAGLLCDVGKLGFEMVLRNVDTTAADWQGYSFEDLESAHFGVDHAEMGAAIAVNWRLPGPLVNAIRYHHQPSKATEGAILAASVHVADSAMMMLGVGLGKDGLQYEVDPQAFERVSWKPDRLNELVEKVLPFVEEAKLMLTMNRK